VPEPVSSARLSSVGRYRLILFMAWLIIASPVACDRLSLIRMFRVAYVIVAMFLFSSCLFLF